MTALSPTAGPTVACDEAAARLNEEIRGYVALWRAVVYEQMELALRREPTGLDTALAIRQAQDWFKSAAFLRVCAYAQLEPDWVLRAYERRRRGPALVRQGAATAIRRFRTEETRRQARS